MKAPLPRLLVGLFVTAFLCWLNYRGIRASAVFQNWATSAVIGVFLVLVAISASSGSPANLKPHFSHAPLLSILLTLQIVPYYVTGFESVPKVAEESHPGFPPERYFVAIALALLLGAGFLAMAVGFGISGPGQVRDVIGMGADGVIVGSAIVGLAAKQAGLGEILHFVKALKEGTRAEIKIPAGQGKIK